MDTRFFLLQIYCVDMVRFPSGQRSATFSQARRRIAELERGLGNSSTRKGQLPLSVCLFHDLVCLPGTRVLLPKTNSASRPANLTPPPTRLPRTTSTVPPLQDGSPKDLHRRRRHDCLYVASSLVSRAP